jgi:hypothetical protein
MKGNGKIAKLPDHIREELNTRLRKGETQVRLAIWLNGLPEVQAVITEHFGGKPIRQQNLVEWKQHSYKQWLAQKFRQEIMAANQNPDPALKELQDTCQNYIRNLQAENLGWYRRSYTDAIFGLPSLASNLADKTKAEAN